MSDNQDDTAENVIECPEHFCPHTWQDREELEAHLRWDHNRSDYKAEKLADRALQSDK